LGCRGRVISDVGWRHSVRRFISDEATLETQSVRGLLRHHLTEAIKGIVVVALVAAALLRLGNPPLFLFLAAYVGTVILLDRYLARPDTRLPPFLSFHVATITWPLAFVVLGAAGWSGDAYHGEVVAVIGLLVAGMVALVHKLPATIVWTLTSAAGLAVGAAAGGQFGEEHVLAVAGVLAGAVFGNRLQRVIEDFLGARRRLLHEVTRVTPSTDPFATAAALLEPLARHTPLKTASLTWFTADGRAVMLGIVGKNLPSFFRPGAVLPEARNEYMRTNAANGPWITGWQVSEDDSGYSHGVAAMGVDAVVYMPLSFEGRLIGMLGAAVANPAGGTSTVAEHIPVLAEMADVVATTLGPAIGAMEEKSSAAQVIDEILQQRRYWPVFQPIRDLGSNRVVGFEALTRFDAPQSSQRLFDHAGLMGRGKDLEIATMTAAVKAAAELPGGAWVSVNSSASMLAETDTIDAILQPLNRPTVIELSEHEMITDYAPIAKAMLSLGPDRSLAVDDAGSGFASLRHILEVRPAYVKMDIGLVQGAATDLSRRALVAGFVHFARDADFTLIAEGIESKQDLATLKKLGVAMGQGYLLGKPERAGLLRDAAARAPSRARRSVQRVHTA
jgi:EAL domain-containing protein (putative c-di-GMP-specific phosphodiesterase class I)